MIIHKLKCKNFKSFREETEINFDNLQGLYKVSGRIGSGKTTIGEIIINTIYTPITVLTYFFILLLGNIISIIQQLVMKKIIKGKEEKKALNEGGKI